MNKQNKNKMVPKKPIANLAVLPSYDKRGQPPSGLEVLGGGVDGEATDVLT